MRKPLVAMLVLTALALAWTVSTGERVEAGKPAPPSACCNPALEPGTNGNPFCFEGHSCCADGIWRCNNPDATPSCPPGEVCDGACGAKNDPCVAHEDCCSGVCKPNGRCK